METMDLWTGQFGGFWEFQKEALFDIRILNADAPSYLTKDLVFLFNAARDEKKAKYNDAAEARRATFTPVIATCDGIFDHEAIAYMKRLSTLLSSKWNQNYSQTRVVESKNASLHSTFSKPLHKRIQD